MKKRYLALVAVLWCLVLVMAYGFIKLFLEGMTP